MPVYGPQQKAMPIPPVKVGIVYKRTEDIMGPGIVAAPIAVGIEAKSEGTGIGPTGVVKVAGKERIGIAYGMEPGAKKAMLYGIGKQPPPMQAKLRNLSNMSLSALSAQESGFSAHSSGVGATGAPLGSILHSFISSCTLSKPHFFITLSIKCESTL